MALNQERERRFGLHVVGGKEPLQKLAIGQVADDSVTLDLMSHSSSAEGPVEYFPIRRERLRRSRRASRRGDHRAEF